MRPRGKKGPERVQREYLDWAFSDYSGCIAADELYDGPFCVLSIVDNCTFHRLIYEVLDRDPTKEDVTRFFTRFKAILEGRGLILQFVGCILMHHNGLWISDCRLLPPRA